MKALPALEEWRERLLLVAEKRLPALTRLKHPETLPIVLDRRRVYVMPTPYGLFFGVLLTLMTLGGLNYNNNPALMLCFLLGSVAHTSLLRAYLNLRGLRLERFTADPVYAGETQVLRLWFGSVELRNRKGLILRQGDECTGFMLEANAQATAQLTRRMPRRGLHPVGRLEVSTRQPLGLFIAWSWVHPQETVLVYPAPEAHAPPLPGRGEGGQPQRRRSIEETSHNLRDYRAGDPLRLIAWKRSAQTGRLMVREYETPAGEEVLLDWSTLAALDPELRIRRLAHWVLEAERQNLRSTLLLPNARIGPGHGNAHVHACLRELALQP